MDPVTSNAGANGATGSAAAIASSRPATGRRLPAGRTWQVVLLLGFGYLLLWGIAAALGYRAPDIDSAEQFVWAVSLEGGYFKHPPLPTWIMHGLVALFGASVVLPVVAAQACIAIALALVWRLGCEFVSPQRSGVATLLTSLVTYYNIGGDSFNHNTVLLPFQAAALLLFYLATRLGGRWLWVSTGLIAGLSVLVKYVALAPLAGMVLYFVLDRSLHQRAMLRGALLGACTFVLVLLPHLWWLVSVDFLPLRYAQFVTQKLPETLAPLPNVADFAFTQLQRLAPFLAALGVLLVVVRRAQQRMDAEAAKPTGPQPASVSDRDRLFIWIAALSPLFIVLAVGLFGGTALAARWGTNAFLLIGHVALLWLVLPRAPVPGRLLWHAALWIVLPLQLLLCAGQTIGKTIGAEWLAIPTRPNFPGAALAQMAQDTWRQHAGPRGAPLRLIAADSWLGGNLMLHAQGQPLQVLIDGSARQSPWVASDAVANCGALVLKDISGNRHTPTWPQPALDALLARAETSGVWTLPWLGTQRRAPVGPRALVRWGIISAADADVRCRIGEGSRKDREPPAAG